MEQPNLFPLKTKKCARCGVEKPTSEFYTHKNTKDGLQPYCKDCCREWAKAHSLEKELASFSDTALIEELKKRGYTGKLQLNKNVQL